MEPVSAMILRFPAPQATTQEKSNRQFECPICQDLRFVYHPETRASRVCECQARRVMESRLAAIPPAFRCADLFSLEPDPKRHPKQARILRLLQANPAKSFIFSGRNGTGKTLFCYSLYREAVLAERKVYAFLLADLLEEYRRAETQTESDFRPTLTGEKLRQQNFKYTVLLDEFEKARPTEFASEQLFRLIDAAYTFQHQLLITTNFTFPKLVDHWSRIDSVWGESIGRRLEDMALYVEMFEEKQK